MASTKNLTLGGNGAAREDLAAAPAPPSGGEGTPPYLAAAKGTRADLAAAKGTRADLTAAAAPPSGGEGASSGDDPHLDIIDAAPASDEADLSRDVAPPAEDDQSHQKRAQEFVDKFYNMFNLDQKNIHTLYAADAKLHLTLYSSDATIELKSAMEIKDYWAVWASSHEHLMNCQAHCFVTQQISSLTIILVNGNCLGFRPHSTNFVESFMLNKSGHIISDVLFVFRDEKPFKLPRGQKLKQDPFIPGKNVNLGRRCSARIEENRLRIRKQAEKPAISEASSKKAIGKEAAGAAKEKVSKIPCSSDSREPISVAILYDAVMLGHKPEYHCTETDARMMKRNMKFKHVENPERITCIFNRLVEENLFERAVHVTHDPATVEDIQAVHPADYLYFIDELPLNPKELDKYDSYYTKDMYCSTGTREAIYSAAGATMKACDLVIRDLFKKAFAIVRPPGHHAARNEAEGFCYVNNIAVAAEYLKRVHGIKKKLVVDWDVHHGNGTEEIFYSTDEVLFFNTFNMDLDYPVTSLEQAKRIGRGKGHGYNVNVPLRSGFGDSDMLYVWEQLLIPLIKAYSPEIILVSCGYDAAKGDTLGKCKVSAPCYATLLDMIVNAGNGKVVLSLEGGYNLEVVANCASHCVRAMVGDKESLLDNVVRAPPSGDTVEAVKLVKHNLQRLWDVFKQKPQQNRRR